MLPPVHYVASSSTEDGSSSSKSIVMVSRGLEIFLPVARSWCKLI